MPCPFCAFARGVGDHPDDLVTTDGVMSFTPLNPVVKGHRLFVPVNHVEDAAHDPVVTARTFERAAQWAGKGQPFNLITSVGSEATQSVFHLHVHYIPREEGDDLRLPWSTR